MENNRFFRTVNRINAVALLLLFLGVLSVATLFLVFEYAMSGNSTQTVAIEEPVTTVSSEKMSELRAVSGHNVHWANLVNVPQSGFNSNYRGYQIRNVVFWVGDNMTPAWLFATNEYWVSHFQAVSRQVSTDKDHYTLAFVVESIQADSNGDRQLSADDHHTLGFVRPDGSGYTQVYQGSLKLIDTSYVASENSLIVLLGDNEGSVVRKYSLDDFSLLVEQPVAPPSV